MHCFTWKLEFVSYILSTIVDDEGKLIKKNYGKIFVFYTSTPKTPEAFIPAIQGTPLVTPAPLKLAWPSNGSSDFEFLNFETIFIVQAASNVSLTNNHSVQLPTKVITNE